MKKSAYLFFFLLCVLYTTTHAQNNDCLRIVDTVHLQSRLVTLDFYWSECPVCYFIVSDDAEKEEVLKRFLSKTPQKTDQLYLISRFSPIQFLLLQTVVRDSLFNKMSSDEISRTMCNAVHSSCWPPHIPSAKDSMQNEKFQYLVTDEFCRTKSALALTNEKCIQAKTSRDIAKLWFSSENYHRFPYEVCDASFDSWGIILEVQRDCDFFWSNDQETMFFHDTDTLRLFIPLTKVEK